MYSLPFIFTQKYSLTKKSISPIVLLLEQSCQLARCGRFTSQFIPANFSQSYAENGSHVSEQPAIRDGSEAACSYTGIARATMSLFHYLYIYAAAAANAGITAATGLLLSQLLLLLNQLNSLLLQRCGRKGLCNLFGFTQKIIFFSTNDAKKRSPLFFFLSVFWPRFLIDLYKRWETCELFKGSASFFPEEEGQEAFCPCIDVRSFVRMSISVSTCQAVKLYGMCTIAFLTFNGSFPSSFSLLASSLILQN